MKSKRENRIEDKGDKGKKDVQITLYDNVLLGCRNKEVRLISK